jgi:hypothetical protein
VRHRLDAAGKRYGKVIAFQVSELRAVELLDGVCDAMDSYQLAPADEEAGTEARWVLSAEFLAARAVEAASASESADGGGGGGGGGAHAAPSEHQVKEERRVLRNSCADIVERWEEDLAAAIRDGEVTAGSLPNFLCARLQGCPEVEGAEAEAGVEAAVEGEVDGAEQQAAEEPGAVFDEL